MSWLADTEFSDVLDELYNSGFEYLVDNNQTDRAKRWVNQSYQELCGLEEWPFLRVTVSQAAPMTLTDLGQIIKVTDTTNDYRLYEGDEGLVTALDPMLDDSGNPSYWYLTYGTGGPTLNVWPASTITLNVSYMKNPAPLVADADPLVVPNQFIDAVVLGAMRRAYIDGTDSAGQYNIVKAEWHDRVEGMKRQLLPRPKHQAISEENSEDW